ncbi:MAG: hypothetical protein H6994_09865 [Pseudomonadales bacterium]|nr:hypothetical protein [Pseudomonadales bacterium]
MVSTAGGHNLNGDFVMTMRMAMARQTTWIGLADTDETVTGRSGPDQFGDIYNRYRGKAAGIDRPLMRTMITSRFSGTLRFPGFIDANADVIGDNFDADDGVETIWMSMPMVMNYCLPDNIRGAGYRRIRVPRVAWTRMVMAGRRVRSGQRWYTAGALSTVMADAGLPGYRRRLMMVSLIVSRAHDADPATASRIVTASSSDAGW